ncbi:MAG: hypothetical protein ACQESF_06990 [Nanobdellota archaeon]
MIYNENYVKNYIEINLNNGRSLAQIKQELMNSDIPRVIVRRAINKAFFDERRYLNNLRSAPEVKERMQVEKLWWVFVILIMAIIAFCVYILKNYLLH